MSRFQRRKVDTLALAVIALAAGVGCFASLFGVSRQRAVSDLFADEPSPMLAPYLLSTEGWLSGGIGTLHSGQGNASRTYRMFLDKGESCVLSGAWNSGGEGELDVRLEWRKNAIASWRPPKGAFSIPVSSQLPEPGEFVLRISAVDGGSVALTEPLEFSFELAPPRTHWAAFLFFAFLSIVCWTGLVRFLLLDALSIERGARPPANPRGARITLFFLLVGLALIALHPHWRNSKDFDDFHAIGPAAALAQNGFDADQLYFRSRVRPSFAAFAVPFNSVFRLQFASTSKWPTDNWKRWFDKYDRPGRRFAHFQFAEMSILALALLLGAVLLTGRLFAQAGLDVPKRRVAMLIVAVQLFLILDNVITFSFTMAIIWCAIAAVLHAGKNGGWGAMAWAGCLGGAAALTKESSLAIIPPAAVALGYGFLRSKNQPKFLAQSSLCVAFAAALPLAYYLWVIPGGFANLVELLKDHRYQQELYPESFRSTTPILALQHLWSFSGPFFALAILGFIVELVRGKGRVFWTLFFGAWAAGGCVVFLSPYVLPRFFADLAPPIAYFSVRLFFPVKRMSP